MPRSLVIAVIAGALYTLHPPPAAADAAIRVAGAEQVVFSYARDACERDDNPDAPARAFRDAAGRVHLFATADPNYAFVGRDLNTVKRQCVVVFRGARSRDPAQLDDIAWLMAFWTADGRTVQALVDNEYHPAVCPNGSNLDCWYNFITAAVSRDDGFHFTAPPQRVVAAPLARYDPAVTRPIGYFSATNIVERDGYYYFMTKAAALDGQKAGVCLLRTKNPADAESWHAWDGGGFNVRLGNPYDPGAGVAADRGCAPIDPPNMRGMVLSLLVHRPTGHYLALMEEDAPPRPAFWVAESADLLNWSTPQVALDTAIAGQCGNHHQRAYPSLLDPDSRSRNFEDVGDTAYLYFTQFHLQDCHLTPNRDLVRVPVRITIAP